MKLNDILKIVGVTITVTLIIYNGVFAIGKVSNQVLVNTSDILKAQVCFSDIMATQTLIRTDIAALKTDIKYIRRNLKYNSSLVSINP